MSTARHFKSFARSAILLLSIVSAAQADWPRFRGPNGSGTDSHADTPASFKLDAARWNIQLPGKGNSSPVIINDKIFITCADPSSALRKILCLDLKTGNILWKREYDSRTFKQHPDNSFASASPTANDKHVYFTFITPDAYKVYCLDHAGKDVWSYDMGRWKSQHGCGAPPILHKNMLIVPNDQDGETASIVALDAASGQLVWKQPRKPGNTAASTPCIYQPNEGPEQLILSSSASGLSGLDVYTGKTLWSVDDAFPRQYRCVASPVASQSMVMGTSGEGGVNRAGAAVHPLADKSDFLFKSPTGAKFPYVPSPIITPDAIYMWSDSGTVTRMKPQTGEIVWQQTLKGEFYASPILAGDKLYNTTKQGKVFCIRHADKYELLGTSDIEDKCFSTTAIAGNQLIFRTESRLICVGGK